MKKALKKVLFFVVVIIANFILLVNTVQAVESGEEVTIYSKGYFNKIIQKSGIAIKTTHAVYQENGKEYLYEILKEVDPEYAQIVHFNNVKRVIRALEYHKETGHKLSEHNKEQRQKDSPYNFAYFVLYHDREVLYDRINRRVDLMMEDGLLEEVKGLIEEGYTKDLVSMQGLGYKEFFDYFDGEMSLEETVDKVKRDTRRFAKRQLTWFRREKEVIWLNKKEYEQEKNLLDSVLNIIKEKGIWDGTKR